MNPSSEMHEKLLSLLLVGKADRQAKERLLHFLTMPASVARNKPQRLLTDLNSSRNCFLKTTPISRLIETQANAPF